MPAVEHSFAASLPPQLWLDSDVLISYLVSSQPHHERCKSFVRRIITTGATQVFLSTLTWMEYGQVVTRASFRDRLSVAEHARFDLERWSQREVRRVFVQAYYQLLDELLSQFDWSEVPLIPAVRLRAVQFMADYGMGSQDSVQLASAAFARIEHVASLDAGYRRVEGIHLWNDLIHTR